MLWWEAGVRTDLGKPTEEIAVPATVQSVLAARIDRLPEREKQAAADGVGDREELLGADSPARRRSSATETYPPLSMR